MKWIAGFCALAIVLGVAAVATIPAQTVAPDEAILKLLPQETTGLLVVDVAGIRNAPLFQELIQQKLPRPPSGMADVLADVGFLPERDIDQVTIATFGMGQVVVLARARYNRVRAEQIAQERKLSVEGYQGKVIYTFDNHLPEKQFSAFFMDDLVVAGHNPAVKQVANRMAAASASALENSNLMQLARSIESGNQMWAVGEVTDWLRGAVVPGSVPSVDLMRTLRSGIYAMRFDQGLHAKAVGTFATADTARSTADLLRGLIAAGKLQALPPEQVRLLDGVQIEYSESTITIRFDADGELLKSLHGGPRKVAD